MAWVIFLLLQGVMVSKSSVKAKVPSEKPQNEVAKDTSKKKGGFEPQKRKRSLGEVVVKGVKVKLDEVVQYIDAQVLAGNMSGRVEIRNAQDVLVGYFSWRDGVVFPNDDARYTVEVKSL